MHIALKDLLRAGVLMVSVSSSAQVSQPSGYLPPTDPGYGLYFHGNEGLLEKPSRWGYHEGWKRGREDREEGHDVNPKASDNYLKAPSHGLLSGLTEDQYRRVYRNAFLLGYEHGSRI